MNDEPYYDFSIVGSFKIMFRELETDFRWTLPEDNHFDFLSEYSQMDYLKLSIPAYRTKLSRLVRRYWYGY